MKPLHLTLPPNEAGRDFVVGDVHGEYDKLMAAMEVVNFDRSVDRLISVGDLIDRGDKSWECLNLFYEPWFYAVRGNHEQFMFDAINRKCPANYRGWMANGGLWALEYLDTDEFRDVVADLDEIMPWTITIGDIGICHAQPPVQWTEEMFNFNLNTLIWGRKRCGKDFRVAGINRIYVGHTPVCKISTFGNVTYCDTGAVFQEDAPLILEEICPLKSSTCSSSTPSEDTPQD